MPKIIVSLDNLELSAKSLTYIPSSKSRVFTLIMDPPFGPTPAE
jgi:hypothetical protein